MKGIYLYCFEYLRDNELIWTVSNVFLVRQYSTIIKENVEQKNVSKLKEIQKAFFEFKKDKKRREFIWFQRELNKEGILIQKK